MSLINAVEINPSYIILSIITNKIYLDEERKCFLFFSEYEAKAFVLTHDDTKVDDASYKMRKDLLSSCYAQGANVIQITQNGRVEDVSLGPNRVTLGFYNNNLNANISLLRQTKRKHYLDALTKEKFIVPIRIKYEPEQEIVYGIVRISDEKPYMYLGFSDLEEYQLWADRVEGWKPLLVEFDTMCQIAKNHGFLINPFGNRFLFSPENMEKCQMEKIIKEEKKQ